jgi:hypothetical protein
LIAPYRQTPSNRHMSDSVLNARNDESDCEIEMR